MDKTIESLAIVENEHGESSLNYQLGAQSWGIPRYVRDREKIASTLNLSLEARLRESVDRYEVEADLLETIDRLDLDEEDSSPYEALGEILDTLYPR